MNLKKILHLWLVPEDDQESRKKLESTGKYNYLYEDLSYMECDVIIPVEEELIQSAKKV